MSALKRMMPGALRVHSQSMKEETHAFRSCVSSAHLQHATTACCSKSSVPVEPADNIYACNAAGGGGGDSGGQNGVMQNGMSGGGMLGGGMGGGLGGGSMQVGTEQLLQHVVQSCVEHVLYNHDLDEHWQFGKCMQNTQRITPAHATFLQALHQGEGFERGQKATAAGLAAASLVKVLGLQQVLM